MVTQDFQLNANFGYSSFSVVYVQVESLNFYVAVYDLINFDPFYVPSAVGVVSLLTLSYMYESPGVNVFTNQYYPYHTYAPTVTSGQQIIFYNNSDSVLSFYYYNPYIQFVQSVALTNNTYLNLVGVSPYGQASVVQLI